MQEEAKKREYGDRIREVENASFTDASGIFYYCRAKQRDLNSLQTYGGAASN